MPREITVFCREHQSSFDVEAKAQLICEIRHHSLSVGFPFSEFWQYCCDCRTFSLSDFETGGTARSECPHCERKTTRYFVCGACKTVCYNSDEKTRGKQVELNLNEGVTPFCPACETKPAGQILPHMCRTVEALLLTERTQCPFCLEMTEVKPVGAKQEAPVAAADMSKFCTKCGQGCDSDAMFCVECGYHFSPATNVPVPNGPNNPNQPEPMPLQTAEQRLATNNGCPNCGNWNPGASDFCGDCGGRLTVSDTLFGFSFKPENKTRVYSGLAVGGGLVLITIIAVAIGSGVNSKKAPAANTATATATRTPTLTATPNRSLGDSRVGTKGTLTMDANLRRYPNKDAEWLGTHFDGAVIEILDVDSTGPQTWFKIKVNSVGVSVTSGVRGKEPGSEDVGWVNSYPVSRDGRTRRNLIAF